MNKGTAFLRAQVNGAAELHLLFTEALKDHEGEADDQRFRDLCSRYMPPMLDIQRALEAYEQELNAEPGVAGTTGVVARPAESTPGSWRELADAAHENDFMRLMRDILMSDRSAATFRIFHEVGRQLGDTRLAELGASGEQQHGNYNRDGNRLAQLMFMERVRDSSAQPAGEVGPELGTWRDPAV
ncbi:MAG TPA: hypothetical protein VFW98_17630 [Gemmatimonadaceae bacterium]|nr:hypothetical protein [Gemmatimonadaceae bacterium]